MNEIEELQRWCKDAGNFPAVDTIARWRALPPFARERLREKWQREDEEADPIRNLDKKFVL